MDDTDYLLASLRRRREKAARGGGEKDTRTVRYVDTIPHCALCAEEGKSRKEAYAEAVLPGRGGMWANVCMDHFAWGGCRLGIAKGQRYMQRGADVAGQRYKLRGEDAAQ